MKPYYAKLDTQYAKKWHVTKHNYPGSFGISTLCGYPVIRDIDKLKDSLRKGDELCLTCMLVRAHSKQKLNRVALTQDKKGVFKGKTS